MLALLDYLSTTKEVNFHEISTFASLTNETFASFLTKLFKTHGHPEIINVSHSVHVEIDIIALMNLRKDDSLLLFLEKMASKAENMSIEAMVEVKND